MSKIKVSEALSWAFSFLEKHGREGCSAEVLLMNRIGKSRTELLMQLTDVLDEAVYHQFIKDVESHAEGIPVQYITGYETFYGRRFMVNPDVLIPRPETEELIQATLNGIQNHFEKVDGIQVVDVGTGSGAIAITLALENKNLKVSTVDISKSSIAVAVRNAEMLGAEVNFHYGDLLEPFIERRAKFDVIVSNPPYIPDSEIEKLDPIVKNHEPLTALAGGPDGYLFYRKLIKEIPHVINSTAFVAFEVGYDQASTVATLLRSTFGEFCSTQIIKDINGKNRIVTANIVLPVIPTEG